MSVIIENNPIVDDQANKIDYPSISGLMGRIGINVTTRAIQSDNFVTGSSGAGWQLTAEGNLEATSGTFRGAISGSTIDIGGADATSFHVDANGNMWSGAAAFADGVFKVSNAGALTSTSGTIGGFTIGSADLTATGITISSSATITATTLRTGASGSRMNLNSSTLQFYTSADVNFMTISNAGSEIDITHTGTSAAAIDIDYAASGARGTNLIHLLDNNQASGASTDATILYVERASGSTSAKNLVDFFNNVGTGVALEVRQNSTATVAAMRIYQQDVSETALMVRSGDTSATEADIGTIEVNTGATGKVGIYIIPLANTAHMRWFAGSAPASPQEGDFWYDGTNLKFRDSSATKTISWT